MANATFHGEQRRNETHASTTDPTTRGPERDQSPFIDRRITRHCGYEISQQKRKRVEEPVGWGQDHRRIGSSDAAWREEARLQVHADVAAYDLIKLPRLIAAVA